MSGQQRNLRLVFAGAKFGNACCVCRDGRGDIVVEIDVYGVRLPCDCPKEVANVKGEGCGT